MSHEHDPNDLALMQWHDGELTEAPHLTEHELEAKYEAMAMVGDALRASVEDDERGAGLADAVMARLDTPAPVVELPQVAAGTSAGKPSNDNSRTIFGLAGLAAAAAAALFLWGQAAPKGSAVAEAPRPIEAPADPASAEAPRPPEAHPADLPSLTAEVDDDDAQPAVEVASVDFGRHQGSVFYVAGHHTAKTAVVWVNDEDEL